MPSYPTNMQFHPEVESFFDPQTNTISYVVMDPGSRACAVIDSVMDLHYAAGRITFEHADEIIAYIKRLSLQIVCVHCMFLLKSKGKITMDHRQFQEWLSRIDQPGPAQRQQAEAGLSGGSEASASLAAIEDSVGEGRRCPHCGTPGAISRGKARGLRRYRCKGCRKTFNAATGTPLSGLHRKDRWLAFGACPADGLTVRASAERCGFAIDTAFRWRHRFLTAKDPETRRLTGIVEADETCVLQSQKGERNLARKARRRGGKAAKRGLSHEQVPVLVAADRSGATVSVVLPAVNVDTLRSAVEPVVDADIVLVTDGHRACPPCAAAPGLRHEALNLSGGSGCGMPFTFTRSTADTAG